MSLHDFISVVSSALFSFTVICKPFFAICSLCNPAQQKKTQIIYLWKDMKSLKCIPPSKNSQAHKHTMLLLFFIDLVSVPVSVFDKPITVCLVAPLAV